MDLLLGGCSPGLQDDKRLSQNKPINLNTFAYKNKLRDITPLKQWVKTTRTAILNGQKRLTTLPSLLRRVNSSLDRHTLNFVSGIARERVWRRMFLPTCYLTSTLAVQKTKPSFQTATVAITVLANRVAFERCSCALAAATRICTCTCVPVITCHAVSIRPSADTTARVTPLKGNSNKTNIFVIR